ncbi:MAG: hypothetical protein EOO77_33965 [Oxalobacteraceae bacterium]|nr:MAG: hypothetical protein EOO77_33965 [Oxalobacteraceae bacterium]
MAELRFTDSGIYTLMGCNDQYFGWFEFSPYWELWSSRSLHDAPVAWCDEHFDPSTWATLGTNILFQNECDAMAFKLRWV